MTDKASELIRAYDKARTSRDQMASKWRDIADLMRPTKQQIGLHVSGPDAPVQPIDIFDTRAIDANRTYAAGCMSWMTPSESAWFALEPAKGMQGDDTVKAWYSEVTDITREALAESNFYEIIHESYLDDGAFGTLGFLCELAADERSLRFEQLQIGDYAITENSDRTVDQVFRVLKLTPRQAAQKFGEANLHKSMQERLKQAETMTYEFLHVLMPRADADRIPGKIDSQNMPFASVYIDMHNKMVVSESGSWEFPAIVHRHALWSHSPWGWSPGLQSLPDAKQLNYMQQYLDALVEKQVSPPTMSTATFEGQIDLRAGGHTYYKDEESKPTFWPNPGNYMIGEDRVSFRSEQIDRAFYVDLFQALTRQRANKVMTAAEVYALREELLPNFSPTFARKNKEVNGPVIRRVFALLLRAGRYPDAPENLIQMTPEGLPFIPDPEIKYTSRMAIAQSLIHGKAFEQSLQLLLPLSESNPSILDHIDFDKAARVTLRANGVDEDLIRPERDVAAMRQARAEAQAQAAQAEQDQMDIEGAAKMVQSKLV
jgi:hypothetical protein